MKSNKFFHVVIVLSLFEVIVVVEPVLTFHYILLYKVTTETRV